MSEGHTQGFAAEQKQSRVAGAVAIAICVVTFATILVQLTSLSSGEAGQSPTKVEQFRKFDDSHGLAALATTLRVIGLLLVILLAKFLYDAIRLRESSAPRYVLQLGIAGPVLMAIVAVIGFFALTHIVDQFVDLPGTQQTKAMADRISDDDTLTRIQGVAEVVAGLVLAAWLVVVNAAGHGVGLLPKFLAYFGYGVGALTVLAPLAGSALFIGWIGSLGLLALDRWPGGRPNAWVTGKSEPVF